MSDLQKEACLVAGRVRVFKAITPIFATLPDRFKGGEVEKLCGFSKSPLHRKLVAVVLSNDFKCTKNFHNFWVKPNAAPWQQTIGGIYA